MRSHSGVGFRSQRNSLNNWYCSLEDIVMSTFDFSPLYRNTIGFDRIADLLDSAAKNGSNSQVNYPPYNIEMEDENHYIITIAVAGFDRNELDIVSENGVLTVDGRKNTVSSADSEQSRPHYLHQGIAFRSFKRKFQLAEYVEVDNAELQNGLLTIYLVRRIPEAMKPKRIEISGGSTLQSNSRASSLDGSDPTGSTGGKVA
jgi:molecular chaperone IbpA